MKMNLKKTIILVAAGITFGGLSAKAELPNVLLVGDSISIQYTKPTKELLKSTANVVHHPGNSMWSSMLLKKLDSHLAAKKWAVIHFNVGNWDVGKSRGAKDQKSDPEAPEKGKVRVSEEKYKSNIEEIVKKLKATGAKLVWGNTTMIPSKEGGKPNPLVPVYNEIAAKVMKENGIVINDLYTLTEPTFDKLQRRPGDCHFNETGCKLLAEQVAENIKKLLK